MNNKIIRNEIVEWISEFNNQYELTITFFEGTSNCEADQTIKTLFKFLNQRLFTRRYIKHNHHLNGIVVRELQINNTLHYHCIINDKQNNLPDFDAFKSILSTCIKKLTASYNPNLRLIGDNCWEVQRYYNDGTNKLERYITKNLELRKMTVEEAFDSIGILDIDNVCFGGDPKRRILLTQDRKYRS